MAKFNYYANGAWHGFQARSLPQMINAAGPMNVLNPPAAPGPLAPAVAAAARPAASANLVLKAVAAIRETYGSVSSRFHEISSESKLLFDVSKSNQTVTFATATIIVNEATSAQIKWLTKKYTLRVLEEGSHGKVLLAVPDGNGDGMKRAFQISEEAKKSGKVTSIHPNFVRARIHRFIEASVTAPNGPGAAAAALPWNLQNTGSTGVAGADVKAVGAWAITTGVSSVRVAVLDEGVDTSHAALSPAVVDQKDFVDGNSTAMPDRNDAHGTACAGIIVSRDTATPGLAKGVSLVAARIAKSNINNPDLWIFDDMKTANAIDWCWDDAHADVLSNSWGGGNPSDAISRAFNRARTQGRGGKGCVVVIAAGNEQSAVSFPGTLPNVLTVGASNQWDERKTKTSQDGEFWWGSNFGPELALMAPGVKIHTTDITGTAGYSTGDFTTTFNGTSSACPHVAAAAALVLSKAPGFTEAEVRDVLTSTCDPMTGGASKVGHGRLNAEAALNETVRRLAVHPAAAPKKVAGKGKKKAVKKPAAKKAAKKKQAKRAVVQAAAKRTPAAAGKASAKKTASSPAKKSAKKSSPRVTKAVAKKTSPKKKAAPKSPKKRKA